MYRQALSINAKARVLLLVRQMLEGGQSIELELNLHRAGGELRAHDGSYGEGGS